MFPIIPVLAILAIIGGVSTLSWYSSLSREQQIAADRRMNQIALQWFRRKYSELSESQKAQVSKQVEQEFS